MSTAGLAFSSRTQPVLLRWLETFCRAGCKKAHNVQRQQWNLSNRSSLHVQSHIPREVLLLSSLRSELWGSQRVTTDDKRSAKGQYEATACGSDFRLSDLWIARISFRRRIVCYLQEWLVLTALRHSSTRTRVLWGYAVPTLSSRVQRITSAIIILKLRDISAAELCQVCIWQWRHNPW